MDMFEAMANQASNARVMNLLSGVLTYSSWWTSTEEGADSVRTVSVRYQPLNYADSKKFSSATNYNISVSPKTGRYSARCVKDEL